MKLLSSKARTLTKLPNNQRGFTLIEVLIALAILAISLTAIVKATSSNVKNTKRVEEQAISHWVQMHAIAMLQLKLLAPDTSVISQKTRFLNQSWFWQAKIEKTTLPNVTRAIIRVSKTNEGPFVNPIIAFIRNPESDKS